jgi:geranylgeranyl pyrophosphate synthase
LDDWFPESANKKIAGTDISDRRPTLLHAWAANREGGQKLSGSVAEWFDRFQQSGLFDQARRLAAKYSEKARETVANIDPPPLRALLLHFVETLGMG